MAPVLLSWRRITSATRTRGLTLQRTRLTSQKVPLYAQVTCSITSLVASSRGVKPLASAASSADSWRMQL